MADENSRFSRIGGAAFDVAGGIAAAGAIAVGTATITNSVDTLEYLAQHPPQPVTANGEKDETARNAKLQAAAGAMVDLVGAGTLGAILASRRNPPVSQRGLPQSWGSPVDHPSQPSTPTPRPPEQVDAARTPPPVANQPAESWGDRHRSNEAGKGSSSERS